MTGCRAILPLIAGLVLALPVAAQAPGSSLVPVARPVLAEVARPDAMVVVTRIAGVQVSLRPLLRPQTGQSQRSVTSQGLPHSEPVQVAETARGSVCGRRDIKGRKVPRIPPKLRGCGVRSPVQITEVSGVSLSQPATMDCTTAKALNRWVDNGVIPTIGRRGGGVSSLQVIAHYSCRTRNSQPGAKISEHGKGHAIDISAINLNDGSSLTVLQGWKRRKDRRLLSRMHKNACGPFSTVLGPKADRFHQDHFHLDTARGRGNYCR